MVGNDQNRQRIESNRTTFSHLFIVLSFLGIINSRPVLDLVMEMKTIVEKKWWVKMPTTSFKHSLKVILNTQRVLYISLVNHTEGTFFRKKEKKRGSCTELTT